MKIFKKTLTILPLLLLLFTISLVTPKKAEATRFFFKSYTLTQDQTIDEDIYIVGDDIKINGVVDGDVFALGDTIQVNGTITGDVYLMGGKVDLNTNIYGSTYIFGNNTTIEGLITENAHVLSTFLNYSADTQKDLLGLYVEGTLKGSVGDDLRIMGMRSTVESVVRGDLVLLSDQQTITDADVKGEIYDSTELQKIAQAQGVDYDKAFTVEKPDLSFTRNWQARVLGIFINFLSMLLVGFIIIVLSPVKTYEVQERITGSSNEFLKSLVAGFLIVLVIPIPLLILLFTVIGSPAAILIIGILSFIMLFGKIWVETAFGREILVLFGIKEYRPYKSFLVGRLLSVLVNIIPIIRGFYNTILSLVALGAVVRMKRGYYLLANKQAKELRKESQKKTTKKKTSKKSSKKKGSKKK